MRTEKRLIDALFPLGLPVQNGVYSGGREAHFVFVINTVPTNFADDAPQCELHLIAVHLYAPPEQDVTALIDSAKAALVQAGFDYPEITNASDAEWHHTVLETQCVEGVCGYGGNAV